jgi:hypothetical protein
MTTTDGQRWPSILVADWQDTRDTLQLYTQVVGKVRMANEPLLNHWWNVALYVSVRGLTTSLIPHPTGPAFQIDFDFVDHRLDIATVTGERRSLDLVPRPVADFYAATMAMLDDLGVATDIWSMPVEIAGSIPFDEDHTHAATTPMPCTGSGSRSSRCNASSRPSAAASSASRARCTSSGARSTWRSPGSRAAPRHRIPVARRTADRK